MTPAYIALGANLGDPMAQVEGAKNDIAKLAATRLVDCSPWYRSKAIGPGEQQDYVNGVALIETELAPGELLTRLKALEKKHGRIDTIRWGPRHLDLDILLYGNTHIDSEHLHIPHPRLQERNFVIIPLRDIAADLVLPDGTAVSKLADVLGHQNLHPIPAQ